MGDLFGSSGSSTTVNTVAPMTPEEQQLIGLQTQIAQQQLGAIQAQAPLNAQLLAQAQQGVTAQNAYQTALDAAISPQDQAAAAATQFKNAGTLSSDQMQLAQMQIDALKQGGVATDQQKQAIADATNAAITAGTGDINTQTQRGIGMISDELANSRGLRLSDSPIGSEAALLTRAGSDQVASLTNNLRANQASATLNYPLAVQGLQSGINTNQQNMNQSFQNFQDQLRQQATTNRLAMTGPAITQGLGLSSIGGGASAIGALDRSRGTTTTGDTSSFNPLGTAGIGGLASGIGAVGSLFLGGSDRRLKADIKKVGNLESGIGIYTYRYKGEDMRRMGVMADEVKKVLPSAVKKHSSGFDLVDYGQVMAHAASAV